MCLSVPMCIRQWMAINEWVGQKKLCVKKMERTHHQKIKGEIIAILKCHPVMTVFSSFFPTHFSRFRSFVSFLPFNFYFSCKTLLIFPSFTTRFCRFFLSFNSELSQKKSNTGTEHLSLSLSFQLWPDYFWHVQYKNEALSWLNLRASTLFFSRSSALCWTANAFFQLR